MASTGLEAAKAKIKSFGQQTSVAILEEVRSALAPLLNHPQGSEISVVRDIAYGAHPRHRLNVFSPRQSAAPRDVLIFVHGGAFVMGDKEEVPRAFFDNVGHWAAGRGMIGVTINYRLAPDHPWPSGVEDVAAVLEWARTAIAEHGGNPDRIFLMGHSAGAAHTTGYVANAKYWNGETPGLAGCICVSGIYDLNVRPVNATYFGEDEMKYEVRSPLTGLAESDTPLLVILAENDPAAIQRHAMSLFNRRLEVKQSLPRFAQIRGHNHFSVMLHLNTQDTALGDEISAFVGQVSLVPPRK